MQKLILRIIGVLIIVLFSACNFPRPIQLAPNTATDNEMIEPTEEYIYSECAFMWANDQLPELSEKFNQALQDTLDAKGYAQAYGENCVSNEGEVVRFLAMETGFYITLQVDNLEDKQILGKRVEKIMQVLGKFPTDEIPGLQPGYVGITFETAGNNLKLWVMRTEIETALESGLRGTELFEALQIK